MQATSDMSLLSLISHASVPVQLPSSEHSSRGPTHTAWHWYATGSAAKLTETRRNTRSE